MRVRWRQMRLNSKAAVRPFMFAGTIYEAIHAPLNTVSSTPWPRGITESPRQLALPGRDSAVAGL